jgi:hypothetical protein
VTRPTPIRPDNDGEDLVSRLVVEAGDPTVAPRPEHVAAVRALLHDRLGSPRTGRRLKRPWLALAGLAAACLVAVVGWPRGGRPGSATSRPEPQASNQNPPAPQPEATGAATWSQVRHGLDISAMPAFCWPVQESSRLPGVTAIPRELLN